MHLGVGCVCGCVCLCVFANQFTMRAAACSGPVWLRSFCKDIAGVRDGLRAMFGKKLRVTSYALLFMLFATTVNYYGVALAGFAVLL